MIPKIFTKRPGVLIPILLGWGLLITFGWSLHAPTFITHEGSILRLPLLAWWKNVPLIFSRDFLMFSEGQFRPLSYTLLAVVRTFVRAENALFWHIWLLAFHALNAVLLYVLVRHFSKHLWSAGLAALLFGLHPLISVVVNHVDSFHYILGLTFYLGAFCCYLAFVDTLRKRFYAASVGLFLLGVFTSKVVFTLPLLLGAYEGLYRRSGLRTVLGRLLLFVAIPVVLSPLWWCYKPHPLYYKYVVFPSKAGWYSFFSVVGATGWYAKGLLFGWNVPVVLHEVVERILRFGHWRFLLWGVVDLAVLIGAGWALRRKWWAGLGVILLFGAMVPFASTTWNGVEEYISWAYLYVPLTGMALLVGGLADGLWSSARRGLRTGGLVALGLVVLWYGLQQARLNLTSRSTAGYWGHILWLNPKSEIASLELGKAYLKEGKEKRALRHLFSPAIKQIHASCLAMSRYYCARGDHLDGAIHLRMGVREETGLQFQHYEMAAAELLYAAGALDYAQEALGKSLMANPYNVAATERLAEIWMLKGHVAAAQRLTERASEIAPFYPEVGRMRTRLNACRRAAATSDTLEVMHPPMPNWLRYVIQGVSDSPLRQEIVLSSETHLMDPVIQMEASIYLLRDGQHDRALSKLDLATQSLSACAYVWAIKCWAAAEAGIYEEAEAAGQRALELDPRSPTVHTVLGFLDRTLAGSLGAKGPTYQRRIYRAIGYYRRALQLNPRHVAAHNRLGNLLAGQGKLEEAVEHYRQALRIQPDYAQAHYNLGVALLKQDKIEEAIVHFRRALRIQPDYAQAHNNLGAALLRQGKPDEAIVHFQEALRIQPDYAKARDNLRTVQMGQRR